MLSSFCMPFFESDKLILNSYMISLVIWFFGIKREHLQFH